MPSDPQDDEVPAPSDRRLMLATQNLRDQANEHDNYCHSLHSAWRAVGKPEGRSPEDWLRLAEKFLDGMADYHARLVAEKDGLGGELYQAKKERMVWRHTLEMIRDEAESFRRIELEWKYSPFVREGDLMATVVVADHYANYLDMFDELYSSEFISGLL